MNQYLEKLNEEIREYLTILSPEFPEWLLEYIYTPEMLRLDGIGMSCGTLYTKVYNDKYFYSSLTHSVAVALIIWNFTHDKKQTISGLFHDIATPVFKHCIDFMNGDSEHQESTEERTEQIIKISKLWPRWIEDEDRLCMQFIADIVKSMNVKGYITIDDLYKFSENEILELIKNCNDTYIKDAFNCFQNATRDSIYIGNFPNNENYCTSVKGKKRYVNPLTIYNNRNCRIKDISNQANDDIENFLNMELHEYIGFNFDFKPYNL